MIYKSINDLILYNFDRIVNTGDVKWLCSNYDGTNEVETKENLVEIWAKIMQEYEEYSGDGTTLLIAKKQSEIHSLAAKHDRVVIGLETYFKMAENNENKAILFKLLASDGFIIDLKAKPTDNRNRLVKQLDALLVKIKLKAKELESLLPSKIKGKKGLDIDESLFILENVIDSKYQLSTKNITVKRYLMLIKEAEKRSNGKR